MKWKVVATHVFEAWFETLTADEQEDVEAVVSLLAQRGPQLARPYADTVKGSRHSNMKELRVQSGGKPLRAFFAFDPARTAVVLIGGDKTGDKRFYERLIPQADALLDEHLAELKNTENP